MRKDGLPAHPEARMLWAATRARAWMRPPWVAGEGPAENGRPGEDYDAMWAAHWAREAGKAARELRPELFV